MKKMKVSKDSVFMKFIDWMIDSCAEEVYRMVDLLREKHPHLDRDELARLIVSRSSMKNGVLGAITSVGGIAVMPIAVPTDLWLSWKIQIAMVLAVAYLNGYDARKTDLTVDILIVLAGDNAFQILKDLVLKRTGLEATAIVTRKVVEHHVAREAMKAVRFVLSRRIVAKAGEKSFCGLTRSIPLLGAPVGFAFNWTASRAVGSAALRYYGDRDGLRDAS